MKLVECVPNFSEGRNLDIIKSITDEIESVDGVKLLDVDPGKDTNRTVVTVVGTPDEVVEAVFIVEGISTEKEVLQKRMKILEEKIRLNLKPKEIDSVEPLQDKNQWSMFIEFTAEFRDIHTFLGAIVNYGPSSVEVIKPDHIELDSYHLQKLVSDFTSAIHYYTSVILNATLLISSLKQEKARLDQELAKTLQSESSKASKNSTSKAQKTD